MDIIETSEGNEICDMIETENLDSSIIKPKTKNHVVNLNIVSGGSESNKEEKLDIGNDTSLETTVVNKSKSISVDEIKSNAVDRTKSNTVDETREIENDEWEVVEASSEESDASAVTEYDIKIPLKLLESTKTNTQATSSLASMTTSEKDINVEANTSDCVIIDPSPKKNIQPTIQNESHIYEKNINQSTQNKSTLNEKNIQQSTQNQTSVTEKQKTLSKIANPNTKKRKKRLYTGDSSDENDVIVNQSGNQGIKYVPEVIIDTQNILPTQVSAESRANTKERYTITDNATFIKDKSKCHSDTEITFKDNLSLREKYRPHHEAKTAKLHDITERDSSDEDIVEVPRSPHATTSHHSMIPVKRERLTREKSSHSHNCHCSTGALLGSPNSKRAKRQKLMQQMWQEKERKLKQKMVKKVKNIFFQVLESLVTSSDASDDFSDSEDEDKMLKVKKHTCRKHGCVPCHAENKSENVRDLKRELQYWKNKAKNIPEVLSPQERQIREMKADLNYWKNIATSRSALHHEPSSSHPLAKTSTPEKTEDIFTELPMMSRVHDTSRVSSSADILTCIPQDSNPARQVEYTSDEEMVPNAYKHKTQSDKVKPADTLVDAHKALNVMSRTRVTEKEKNQIVKYLISHYDTLELLRGNMFWMQMAHDLNTHRSWHSLKNSFFQNIIKNLELYEIPIKVRNKIISLAKQYM